VEEMDGGEVSISRLLRAWMYLGWSNLQRNPCPGYDAELAEATKNGEEKLRALGG
jgi:hypothetical protein